MIRLENASRWYGQVIGINDVTCQIGPGITALLGPNGAGKSTLMKLVTGQLRPTTGSVSLLGQAPFANSDVLRRLGYCPEIEKCYEEMSGREMTVMLASLSGLSGKRLHSEANDAIERVGMTANADRRIAGYSKGMRQRIKLAQAIIHDPDVLILDEPLNGLDPVGRREVVELLFGLAQRGKCIVVSSHILYEVESMTKNILLMSYGRLLAQGDVYALRELIDKHPHQVAIRTPDVRRLAERLIAMPSVVSASLDRTQDDRLDIRTNRPNEFYAQFPEIVLEGGFVVTEFSSPDNNLESVFRYLVKG